MLVYEAFGTMFFVKFSLSFSTFSTPPCFLFISLTQPFATTDDNVDNDRRSDEGRNGIERE